MKFSIVIPVFNVAPYLGRCLESVAASADAATASHGVVFEILCVDDGSTDGSGSILDAFAVHDPRFRVSHRPNGGVSAARNAALDAATGDWIGFVDADDRLSPLWFSRAAELVSRFLAADIAVLDGLVVDGSCFADRVAAQASPPPLSRVRRYSGWRARRWAFSRFSKDGWPVLSFVRRSFLSDNRFIPGITIKEDILFFLSLSLRVGHIAYGAFPGYFYTIREGSALRRAGLFPARMRFLEELVKLPSSAHKAISRSAFWDLLHWLEERCPPDAAENAAFLAYWRRLRAEGRVSLRDIYPYWALAIWLWLKTGNPAHVLRMRRARAFAGKLLSC